MPTIGPKKLIDWLIDCLIGWLIAWSIGWLVDWLMTIDYCYDLYCYYCHSHCKFYNDWNSYRAGPNWYSQCSGGFAIMIYMRRILFDSAINKSCCIVWYQQTWLMLNGWGMARTPQVEVVSCVSFNSQVVFGVSSGDLFKRRLSWDQLKLRAGDMNEFIPNVGLCCIVPIPPPNEENPQVEITRGFNPLTTHSQKWHCVSARGFGARFGFGRQATTKGIQGGASQCLLLQFILDAVTSLGER